MGFWGFRLNLGAEGQEDYFEDNVEKGDPSKFNDPKQLLQSRDKLGFEYLSGKSFDPLVQGDVGVLEDQKVQAKERVKFDCIDHQSEGMSKPYSETHRKTGILSTNPRTSFSTDNKRYTESDQDQVKDEVKSLDCDEKLKGKLIRNPINSRMSVQEHQRNTTFSREKGEHYEESTNTTQDKILKATDDPTLQYDRKMELEKRAHLKGMKDPQQRRDYIHYYDAVIPSDKPLQDELHVEFLHKYRQEKAKDLEVPDRKLGSPLSTGEYGIIHGRWNPRPDGRGT